MSELELKEVFSRNLQRLMDENDIKNNQLADYIGVSESTVGKWLLKKSLPRMGVIEKLAKYFDVNKSDLLENKKNKSSYEINKQKEIKTIAAHFDGKMTEQDMQDIINFVEFVKSKRDK